MTVTVGVGVALGFGGIRESLGSTPDVERITETTPIEVN